MNRQAFEQACHAYYLERVAAGKAEPGLTLEQLMWRNEDGTYGVLMNNAAWWGWEAAVASQPAQAETVGWVAFTERMPPKDAARDDATVTTTRSVLVTNNLLARDRMGRMSHVWWATPIAGNDGDIVAFDDADRMVRGLTHWLDPFATPPQAQPAPDDRIAFGAGLAALLSDVRDWFDGEFHLAVGVVAKAEVRGDLQHDDHPPSFDEVYVNQGGGGITGDDFHGDAYFHIGNGQYLHVTY